MTYELLRITHFIAIIVLAGALLIENMAIKPQLSAEDVRNLAKVDAIFGISAIAVFLIGLTLWLWVGKPPEFYSSNPLFHAKLGLFVFIFLLSTYPTVFFIKNRKSSAGLITVPPAVIRLLRSEMILFLALPILASLMARGVGL